MRVAGIDCGTNSIRLLISDVEGGSVGGGSVGASKVDVHREMRVVRLGQGVDRTGELAPEALERTREALASYAATVRALGVERIRMVATSATRDARNRGDFVDLVVDALGIPPEVVTGDEEAALSFDGATRGLDPDDGPFLVVDIGGGSTELVLGTRSVEAARSVDVGCVRLTERHLHSDPPTQQEILAAEADVVAGLALVRELVPVERARTSVWLAGSATTVAAACLELPRYDSDAIHLAVLEAAAARAACDRLIAMTRAERAALPFLHPGRVDVIGAGALVLRTLVDRMGVEALVISEADILDGIVWSAAH